MLLFFRSKSLFSHRYMLGIEIIIKGREFKKKKKPAVEKSFPVYLGLNGRVLHVTEVDTVTLH